MKERRDGQQDRLAVKIKARYYLQEEKINPQECTITDISRGGARLVFSTSEKLAVGTLLFLETPITETREPTTVKGVARWVKPGKKDFLVGVEAASSLDEKKFTDVFLSALEL